MSVWHSEWIVVWLIENRKGVPNPFLLALVNSDDLDHVSVGARCLPYSGVVDRELYIAAATAFSRLRDAGHWSYGGAVGSIFGFWGCVKAGLPYPDGLHVINRGDPEDEDLAADGPT